MKRLLWLLLILVMALPLVVSAQATPTTPPNPNAQIIWPPPVYVVSGQVKIWGTANLPNMINYFIEFRPLNEDLTPQGTNDVWFPAILPSQAAIQQDVLGVWDTTLVADGLYQMRLTINVAQANPVYSIVSPLRIENTPSIYAGTPTPLVPPTAIFIPPTQAPQPTIDTTPRVTITSSPSGNIREGDSTFYRIITSVPNGTTARIIGISNQGSGWFQIQLDDGRVGWVAPSIITSTGDLTGLPRVQPPPPPPTAIPTATPLPTATPAPVSQANLVAGIVVFDPTQPACQQTFTVGFDVANLGSAPSVFSGTVSLVDTRAADGSQQGSTVGGFPILQAGQTFRVNMQLTINTYYNEQHNITLQIDPSNQIPENNESDNGRTISYTLAKGNCP